MFSACPQLEHSDPGSKVCRALVFYKLHGYQTARIVLNISVLVLEINLEFLKISYVGFCTGTKMKNPEQIF